MSCPWMTDLRGTKRVPAALCTKWHTLSTTRGRNNVYMGCSPTNAYFLTYLESGMVCVSAYRGMLAIISLT